ncbi:MAG: SRPBCC family protein [Chloroflexi bacterium]|nr:SRPBCC family protein [Chloroflexota bacterium]
MITYSSDVSINRSPGEVLDALLDPALYSKWTPMVDVEFDGSGRPGVGTTGRFRMAEGPIKGILEMRISELDPGRRLVVTVTHPTLDWIAISTVAPEGAGTRLTYAGTMGLKGWRRLLEPFMASEVRNGEAAEARKLKAVLEAGAQPQAT